MSYYSVEISVLDFANLKFYFDFVVPICEILSKNNIPYVVVIGGNEVELGLVEIKDMNNYSTNRVSINDIGKMIGIIKK